MTLTSSLESFLKRGLDGLGRALNIRLDDDVEGLHLAGLDLAEDILKADLLRAAHGVIHLLDSALLGKLSRHALVGNGIEHVARARDFGQAGYLDRRGGTGLGHALSLVVYHGTDAADGGTGDDDIARLERAVLHQNGHYRAAALVETRLDDSSLCGTVGVGLQLLNLGENDEVFKQIFDTHAGLCGYRAHNRISAPLFRRRGRTR